MSAEDEIRRSVMALEAMTHDVFLGVATEVQRSIVEGSEITGAAGQPVDEGILKGSWQLTFPTPTLAAVDTNVIYAEDIEDGIRDGKPLTLRSLVGGFNSVKRTIAGLPRIVAHVTERVQAKRAGGAS